MKAAQSSIWVSVSKSEQHELILEFLPNLLTELKSLLEPIEKTHLKTLTVADKPLALVKFVTN